MHTPLLSRLLSVGTLVSVTFAASPFIASVHAEGTPSISITSSSDLDAKGALTLLDPAQESIALDSVSHSINPANPGHYTLFIKAPEGTHTTVQIFDGPTLLETIEHPQASFDVTDTSQLRLVIKYSLKEYGLVGVTSIPAGIPFTLKGPDKMKKDGVTPMSFEKMPVGLYSVTYKPKGCPLPPAKSEKLSQNDSVYFGMEFKCDALEIDTTPSELMKDSLISPTVYGETVVFTDVPQNSWFAEYAFKAAKFGIISGYKNKSGTSLGLFGPERSVTLAELSKITHVMMGLDEKKYGDSPDNLSAHGQWYSSYVTSAEKMDWSIYTDPALNLDRPATRGEILKTFLQALDIPLEWPKGDVFKDVSRRTSFASSIETAYRLGIVSGKTDSDGKPTGYFGPNDPVNRAELSKMVSVILDKYRNAEK